MDVYNDIFKAKKMQGFTWSDLAEGLPVKAGALTMAFNRKNISEYYIQHICDKLGLDYNNYKKQNSQNNTQESAATYQTKQPRSISLLEIRDDLKADLNELKQTTAKKQHVQGLSDSMAGNFEDVSRALLKILQHNERVEEFINQIDLEALNKATRRLNEYQDKEKEDKKEKQTSK